MTANGTARANGSSKAYRVGVIGHTGRGNYGHSLDLAFQDLPGVEYVAVADANPAGREECVARTGALRSYADYREMVERERPDLVSICPTFLDEHADMVRACAATGGVRGIFLEKPMAGTLTDCDAIVEACAKADIKLAVGHGRRFDPWIHRIRALIASGCGTAKCRSRSGDAFVAVVEPPEHRPRPDQAGGGTGGGHRRFHAQGAVGALEVVVRRELCE